MSLPKFQEYIERPVVMRAEVFLGIDSPQDIGGVLSRAHIKRYSLSTDHCHKCDRPFSKHGSLATEDGEVIVCPDDYVIMDSNQDFTRMSFDKFMNKYEPKK